MSAGRAAPSALRLKPAQDVEQAGVGFVSSSADPFLTLEVDGLPQLAGRFVEITYRLGLWDEPVRPVFRFRRGKGSAIERIAAGPIEGAGIWIGRLPPDIVGIEVSPTNRVGPFSFRIESIRPRAWLGLLAAGVRHRPRSTRSAILTRLIGWEPESDVNLAWAIGATPFSNYPAWRAARRRDIDLDGFDTPRFDWRQGPSFEILVGAGEVAAVDRSLDSLRKQVFPFWRAVVPAEALDGLPPDDRIATARTTQRDVGALTVALAAGETLLPHALAYVAEQARRQPQRRAFVGDILLSGPDGRPRPLLRPGWSPRLEAAAPPAGAVFMRDVTSAQWDDLAANRPNRVLAGLASHEIGVLRRPLAATQRPPDVPFTTPEALAKVAVRAAIVVPTRDHAELLRRVVASLRAQAIEPAPHLVIVDNGSTVPEALADLTALRREPNVTVLDFPQAFNFSAMCNAGAEAAQAEVLVFLNDDTEFRAADALARLVAHAVQPDVGAVGARMTYPDGRLQHVGVVVGMGESAGHFGALAPADDPGWAGRNRVAHEVSAVTGACLAVARDKFFAVGGFDAEHLPIELSDIDLCLKLCARGWQTIVDPAVRLMHEESVSRGGATLRRLDVYAEQRRVFIERWRHVLRDDPFFHPGLSLYSCEAALG